MRCTLGRLPIRRPCLALVSLMALVLAACPPPVPDLPEDPELREGFAAARSMTTPRWRARSSYQALAGESSPSRFVSYLFSDMGVAEWPIALTQLEMEQMRAIRQPILPSGISLVPRQPDPQADRQVVISADDEAGLLIIEAYMDPADPPVSRAEVQFDG